MVGERLATAGMVFNFIFNCGMLISGEGDGGGGGNIYRQFSNIRNIFLNLTTKGMNVAYGKESFPSQGPVVNLGEIVSLLAAQNLKLTKIS